MALCVVHLCGPPASGKTELARLIAARRRAEPPFHVRLLRAAGGPAEPLSLATEMADMAESRTHTYSPERIFEQLPAVLKGVKRARRWATVLLETDTDPCHLHAYPYDVRVFVAPAARHIQEVFRTPEEAAAAMQTIMQDTLAFAQEIYGLIPDASLDESRTGIPISELTPRSSDPALSDAQLRHLLSSTIGGEIASRVQFQPAYHGVVESDVVIINTARGGCGEAVDQVARRIESLLARLGRPVGREPMLAVCDLTDSGDPIRKHAVARIDGLIAAATADWPA